MESTSKSRLVQALKLGLPLAAGLLFVAFGWLLPSRFASIPFEVVREAGQSGAGVSSLAQAALLDGNFGAARLLAQAAIDLGEQEAALALSDTVRELESDPALARWGAWDPFLEAAIGEVPVELYSNEPGLVGVLLAKPCREALSSLLGQSRNPLVRDILATGELQSYRRLSPVESSSGRPLEVLLLSLALLEQGDHLSAALREELRSLMREARSRAVPRELEDFYLDLLSLARLYDWGQLREACSRLESTVDAKRLRYLSHRRPEDRSMVFAMSMASDPISELFAYLEVHGDEGFARLTDSLAQGLGGYRLALREQLPIESLSLDKSASAYSRLQASLAPFSLQNPSLSLSAKYGAFFFGSLLAFLGLSKVGSFYGETATAALGWTQRVFAALASLLILVVLSEPHLAGADSLEGYRFTFSLPVLAQVDGELQIVRTETTTAMDTATLLSVAFFFLLQVLVFLICMLKVREIEQRDLDPLVKLKLMENEENLFDSGLYVGIAGTCISLVMQVIGIVEANLLAAYSSNLFGILCVAIVKIRLVRPFKTGLIISSQEQIARLGGAEAP